MSNEALTAAINRLLTGRRRRAVYNVNGLAGCVQQRRARSTGALIGVYRDREAEVMGDPDLPWVTICESHSGCVGHPTLKQAKSWAVEPESWCEDCRKVYEAKGLQQGVAS